MGNYLMLIDLTTKSKVKTLRLLLCKNRQDLHDYLLRNSPLQKQLHDNKHHNVVSEV